MKYRDFYAKLKAKVKKCCRHGHDFAVVEAMVEKFRLQGNDSFLFSRNRVKVFFRSLGANCDCQILARLLSYPGDMESCWQECFGNDCMTLREALAELLEKSVQVEIAKVESRSASKELDSSLAIVYKLAIRPKAEVAKLEA